MATLSIRKTESISTEIERMNDRIGRRAYDIFTGSGGALDKDLDNWLAAEKELMWKPSIELREKDKEFLIDIAVPGMDAKDLNIEVTAEDLLVKGEVRHEHKEQKGTIHTCEFHSANLFRTVHFPKRIDPDKVKAEFKNGILHVRASIERQRAKAAKAGAA